MTKYILVYRGGRKTSKLADGTAPNPEDRAKGMARFKEWLGSIGDGVVSPANPVGPSKIVSTDEVSDGGGPHAFNGYTIINVESMEAALDIARRCPYLDMGTIEVAELMQMGPKKG